MPTARPANGSSHTTPWWASRQVVAWSSAKRKKAEAVPASAATTLARASHIPMRGSSAKETGGKSLGIGQQGEGIGLTNGGTYTRAPTAPTQVRFCRRHQLHAAAVEEERHLLGRQYSGAGGVCWLPFCAGVFHWLTASGAPPGNSVRMRDRNARAARLLQGESGNAAGRP